MEKTQSVSHTIAVPSPVEGGATCNQADGCDPGYRGKLLMEPALHRDVTQAGYRVEISVKTPVALHVLGRTTRVTRTDGTCTQGCDPGYRGKLCEDTCSTACAGKDNSV
ncbi:hypothetical protein RRG08_064835 [Elysia crispata]|uniref:Uncharacterized protein n=1 Tax=Elysia crispata TaxID=231223 RepID=A0AAE0Y1F2_9GAST|nr:hypothetical protein RRG08_064835 [Elysia crispata]